MNYVDPEKWARTEAKQAVAGLLFFQSCFQVNLTHSFKNKNPRKNGGLFLLLCGKKGTNFKRFRQGFG